jgi:DNA-binding transcriptional LysR family regulator
LTSAGEVFLHHARMIISSADRARLEAQATAKMRSASLSAINQAALAATAAVPEIPDPDR